MSERGPRADREGAPPAETEELLFIADRASAAALVAWAAARRRNGQETDTDEAIREGVARGWILRVDPEPPALVED